MNIAEIEKVVKSFQGSVFKRANNCSAGLLRSKIRGTGLQFRDHQIYTYGDDVRFIDWKVSARNSNIHLKTFEEERNTEINVLIDVGPTMFYGSVGVTKLQVCLEVTAMLYLLSQKNNDQVKVHVLINDVLSVMPPQKGKLGVVAFIKSLEKLGVYNSHGKFNLNLQDNLKKNDENKIKNELNKLIYKKKEVVFLSDMDFGNEIKEMMLKSNTCHPVRIISPLDEQPLKYSVNSVIWKGTGLGLKINNLSKMPTVRTNEKYLELFLRRLK